MDRPSDHASKRALRACENCRERKVKCNSNPSSCQQCAHLNLRCVYKTSSTSTRSRANAGSRGSVISRLKGNGSHSVQQLLPLRETTASATVPVSPLLGGPSSHVPLESEFEQAFFRSLVQPYDDYIYCVSPIITAAEISASITTMHDDTVDFQLVHAFGAVTLNLTQPNWRADSLEATKVKRLMDIAISARSQLSTSFLSGYGGSGLRTMLDERFIMAGIFLEICLMGFRRHDEAFLMLREAISLIQLLQVRKARSSHQLDGSERTRQRAVEAKQERLYWEAFIHERFLAIVEYYPVMLEPLEDSIAVEDETLPVQVREGFQSLIQMFCVIDHEFVSHWRRGASATVTKEWIEAKKRELDNLDFMLQPQSVSSSVPMWHSLQARASESPASSQHMATENWTSLNTLQQADLVITRQWMLTLLWQLALSHCVLPSSSPRSLGNDEGRNWNAATRDHGNHGNHVSTTDTTSPSNDHERRLSDPAASVPLSLSFPVRLSQQLRAVITQLGRKYIERHGSGIIQKLFEITATFADVIVHVPVSSPSSSSSSPTAVAEVEEERAQRLRDFEFLLNFLREFAGLDEIQARILSEKAELVRGVEHANSAEALCYTRTEEGK